ncbi:ATP-binding protein [Candidatus Saccharibacteria bacterium]|nr:ATP-binding protein [Candidatus Saccharibacteria bacterium]
MKEYIRNIEQDIKKRLFENGKIIVLYGPRQVGKTTLAKKILRNYDSEDGYFNCEDQGVVDALLSHRAIVMKAFFGNSKIIVLDEAQTVKNIGRSLKIFIDAYPEMNIVATGSSSFDLANQLNEPLTGRHYEYFLYPISFSEIAKTDGDRVLFENLSARLIYGSYPEILLAKSLDDAKEKLKSLSTSYLYKDVFKFNDIKNPEVLTNILRALAYQVGNEVSMTEIAGLVNIDKNTVASYIRLLEQAFIIYRLPSFARNMRNEIKKGKKFYFYDNGIIAALTDNFSDATTGRDVGGLWENLMIGERLKYNQSHNLYKTLYFWRLKNAGEIDLIEEFDGHIYPFEIKWSKSKAGASGHTFQKEYGTEGVRVINKDNFIEFVK